MNLNDSKIDEKISGGNSDSQDTVCKICGKKYSRFTASVDKSPFSRINCCLNCRSRLENKLKNGFPFEI